LIDLGKSGYEVIKYAVKRLPNQDPLVNGKGEPMPEPDYDSEDWKTWETRLTEKRADEVVAFKNDGNMSRKDASHRSRMITLKRPRKIVTLKIAVNKEILASHL
jgi:hypothetical protein